MKTRNKSLAGTVLTLATLAALSGPVIAQDQTDVDFGEDTSEWANDGECDDPRFTGTGMASELEDADISADATDCRTAFEAGTITLIEAEAAPADEDDAAGDANSEATEPVEVTTPEEDTAEIDFGDDTSDWANDGECDDPRFAGEGMAAELLGEDELRDATDCRTAFEAGTIALAEEGANTTAATDGEIDFGDDTSEWANDLECDDPRFVGTGMASNPREEDTLRDATDCRAAFEEGTISLADGSGQSGGADTAMLTALANRIDFGDDSGDWPNDGECDDPDFVGSGAVTDAYDVNRMADATDCRAAFIAGTVTLRSVTPVVGFSYGSDFSEWSNDGQCDDMRFTGPGMAKKLSPDDIEGDATDCQALEASGEVSIIPVYDPSYAAGAPYDASGVDFGDNSSTYANDELCDDPRFVGPGTAYTLLEDDRLADADDCKAAFENGTIVLRDGES